MTIQALDELDQLPAGTTARLIVRPSCRACGRHMALPIDPANPNDRCAHCRAIARTA